MEQLLKKPTKYLNERLAEIERAIEYLGGVGYDCPLMIEAGIIRCELITRR